MALIFGRPVSALMNVDGVTTMQSLIFAITCVGELVNAGIFTKLEPVLPESTD